jgi:Holliday junction DNA helicase RuvA
VIAYVRGTLAEKEPTRAVVEAAGVGYEFLIPLSTYDALPPAGREAKLLAFHCVREDDESLYGFATPEERALFVQLTSVSGVGPKIALALLSGAALHDLSLAIAGGNAKRLAAIKGVGRKTAEKICLELKDKVNAFAALAAGTAASGGQGSLSPDVQDAVLALTALGFSDEKAGKMVADVLAARPETVGSNQIVRLALAGGRA